LAIIVFHPYADPHRDIDGLLVFYRQLERSDLGLMGFLVQLKLPRANPKTPATVMVAAICIKRIPLRKQPSGNDG
jgi:hypothetical protein